jgi:hypothetical protein
MLVAHEYDLLAQRCGDRCFLARPCVEAGENEQIHGPPCFRGASS